MVQQVVHRVAKGDRTMAVGHLLKCVKVIESCPNLAVGDMLWKGAYEILPGGYEYAVCRRGSDNAVIKVRVDHLEECFEVVDVELDFDSVWRDKYLEYDGSGGSGSTSYVSKHRVRRYL